MEKTKKNTEIITVLLGLCIVFGRVIIPTYIKPTKGIVLLELILEIIICIAVVYLNRNKIKEAFKPKKNDNFFKSISKIFITSLKTVVVFLITFISGVLAGVVLINQLKLDVRLSTVMTDFANVLPIAALISQIIVAPITEEIVFRMTLRDLIPNKFLYAVISAVLFAFIHDWFFFSGGIIYYFLLGFIINVLYLIIKDIRCMIGGHMLNNIIANLVQFLNATVFK